MCRAYNPKTHILFSLNPMLMRLKFFLLIGAFCLVIAQAHAQRNEITGTVTDANTGNPLPGVNIVVKNTTIGTTSDAQGEYRISVPQDAETLVFSFVAMKTLEVPINGRSVINVELEAEMLGIDEVVVVAYGVQRREAATGSVSDIKSDKIEKSMVTDRKSVV